MRLSNPFLLILFTWIAGFIVIAVSLGSASPLWYSLAITIGLSISAGTDMMLLFLALLAGSMANSPRISAVYALAVAVLVSIYVNYYGLFPGKGVAITTFTGRAIAASTISILSHLAASHLRGSKLKPGPD
jgi:hypothetical protein